MSTQSNYFFKMCFNIFLASPPGFSHWSLYVIFPHKNPIHISVLSSYALRPPHPFDLITRITIGEQCGSYGPQYVIFLHSPVNSSFLASDVSSIAHIPPSICETKFHIRLKQQPHYSSVRFHISISRKEYSGTPDSGQSLPSQCKQCCSGSVVH